MLYFATEQRGEILIYAAVYCIVASDIVYRATSEERQARQS